ncbi:MAG TPA: hypothetical protein VF548_08660 [Allosphingosinicella sp.]|jgi:hypothetical protein
MDKEQPGGAGGSTSGEPRPEWTAPQVDKLIAGGAEASSGADIEGLDGLS